MPQKQLYLICLFFLFTTSFVSSEQEKKDLFDQEEIFGVDVFPYELRFGTERLKYIKPLNTNLVESFFPSTKGVDINSVIKNIYIRKDSSIVEALQIMKNEIPILELMISPDVSGKVDEINSENKTLKELLDVIVVSGGYDYVLFKDILWVMKPKIHSEKYVVYEMQYTDVNEFVSKIKEMIPDVKMLINEKDKYVVVETSLDNHRKINQVENEIDTGTNLSSLEEDRSFDFIRIETNRISIIYDMEETILKALLSMSSDTTTHCMFMPLDREESNKTYYIYWNDTKNNIKKYKQMIIDLLYLRTKSESDTDNVEWVFVKPLKFASLSEIKKTILFYVNDKSEKIVSDNQDKQIIIYTIKKVIEELEKPIDELYKK